MASAVSQSGEEKTPVTKNPCVSCGLESQPMINVPFPASVDEFRQPGFQGKCIFTAYWWWCRNFGKFGGVLP